MFWLLVVCFTHFAPWVLCHASHMHTINKLDAHTLSLDMFCIHSWYVSLFKTYALWLCLLVYFYFRAICSCLWTNLYLIKFVTMFMFGLFACVLFCRCLVDLHAARNLWLISHHLLYQRGLVNQWETLTTRGSRLFWTLNPFSTISRMHLLWWKGLWGSTPWDQPSSLWSLC